MYDILRENEVLVATQVLDVKNDGVMRRRQPPSRAKSTSQWNGSRDGAVVSPSEGAAPEKERALFLLAVILRITLRLAVR